MAQRARMRVFAADRPGAGIEGCAMREVDVPELGKGQIRVRVQAASLNPADLKVVAWKDGGSFLHAKVAPLVVGYDFSGSVELVGAASSGVKEGDEVFGFLPYSRSNRQGSLAEFVVVRSEQVAPKPAGVSHVDAACSATVGCTALLALRDKARVSPGQRVLVHGASGGVGTFAVQIAKKLGATVLGTCSGSKVDFVRGLGADEVVDYRETDIRDLPGPFDAVIDAAAASSPGACRSILQTDGAYVTTVPSLRFVTGKLSSMFSKRRCEFVVVQPKRNDLAQLGSWFADGSIATPMHARYSWTDGQEALRVLASGKVQGKIGIEVS